MRLKLFSDKQYFSLTAPLVPILYPFFGKPNAEASHQVWLANVTLPAFDPFVETASLYFEMVPIQDADLVVLPNDLEFSYLEEVKQNSIRLLELAKQYSKPTIGFFSSDCSHLKLPFEVDITFRDSLYRSSRNPNEFLMPTWIEDLVSRYADGQFRVRQKQEKAVVGFCGYAAPRGDLKTIAKTLLYKSRRMSSQRQQIPPYHTGHVIRTLALSRLKTSALVQTNFVIRNHAGLMGNNPTEASAYRKAYVENLINSDYILCCRGSGNHSNRLYETLCCGRIPVFIDTDCVLPLDFDIDWHQYCVYVKENELSRIDRKIAEFHQNIAPDEFVEMQRRCRTLWKEKISPKGFFSNLYQHLPRLETVAL